MTDDDEPITEYWLTKVGFRNDGLHMGKLLDAPRGGDIVELGLTPFGTIPRGGGLPSGDEWLVDLTQQAPAADLLDWDQVLITSLDMRTKGQLRRLCDAMNAPLTEPT